MTRHNVFVVGADHLNMAKLQASASVKQCELHPLFTFEEVQGPERYPLKCLLDRAVKTLEHSAAHVHGVMGYWDLPVSALVPLLCAHVGLPSASLSSVIACEHKYWSRLVQRESVPECVPHFAVCDPFAEHPRKQIELDYPFWLKPVKSFQSHLGFKIENDMDFEQAISQIRRGIRRMAEPFNHLLEYVTLPPEVAGIDGNYCIAEELVAGRQCTIEGFILDGQVETYGVVDSIRHGDISSFARYEYPSALPPMLQHRMRTIVSQVVPALGLDRTAFNVEFFCDEARDRLWLIEINPRISQSHADLFEKVDGVSNLELLLDLSIGHKPQPTPGAGLFRCAAKCFVRVFDEGLVTHAPTEQQLRQLESQMPGMVIEPMVHEGSRLSEIPDEDSYSYTLAQIYLGADDREQLLARYHRVVEALAYEVNHRPVAPLRPVA